MLAYNFDEEQELLRPLGAVESYGEDSFTTLERIWFRPTLEIVGLSGTLLPLALPIGWRHAELPVPALARSKRCC